MSQVTNSRNGIKPELSRELSLFHLTMMGTGMMIGAGVFVATGISIGVSGSGGILVTFALNGLIAICSAMAFAELSSALPAAGGAYSYVRQAFGGITGFISGWMNWFALAVAGSLYAITFSTYTLHLLKGFEVFSFLNSNLAIFEKILAVVIAVLFIAINYRGVSETGRSASFIALGQTLTLGIIGIIGIGVALTQPERLTNFSPFLNQGWGKILVTMGFTYVGFEGFEVIGHAGEEAINPRRNIPRAILYAVVIVVTTYLLVAFAAVVGAKPQGITVAQWFAQRGATGFADAIKSLFPFGGVLVTLAAIFSSTSALNATIYSSARVSFAMGRDRMLPDRMASISKKRRVPHVALLSSSVIILVVAALLPVEDVAASADIMFLLIFLLINVSVIKIRREMGDELEYGFLMPFFPVIPVVALVAQLFLSFWLFDMSRMAWAATGLWICTGLVIYFVYAKGRIDRKSVTPILEERRDIKTSARQVMVPVGNPLNAGELVRYAEMVAGSRDAEILIMSVVTVPDQIPLSEAESFVAEKHDLVKKLRRGVRSDTPVHTIIRYSHNVARGIISSVRERNTDLLVLGWKGYTKWRGFEMGSNLDRVIESIPCDIMVVKTGSVPAGSVKRILLPSNGGYHSLMATGIARSIIKHTGGRVTVFNVNTFGEEAQQRTDRRLRPVIEQFTDSEAELKIVCGQDVYREIMRESEKYDLVIMGATGEGFFQQLLFGKLSERVAARCRKTVILTKKDIGIRSWFKRWLGRRRC